MLWIALMLVALWALALATSHKFGGFIHVLIVAAALLLLVGPMKPTGDASRIEMPSEPSPSK